MLAAQRRDLLLDRLRTEGRLVAKDLAMELGVSEDSVRRDLRELAAAGLCQRVYGGALPVSPALADYADAAAGGRGSKAPGRGRGCRPDPAGRHRRPRRGHHRPWPSCRRCRPISEPPSSPTARRSRPPWAHHEGVEIFLIGGRVFKHSMVACGAAAVEAAQAFTADLFLLGVTGIHYETGLTTGDADEAAMKTGAVAPGGRDLRAGQCGEDRRRLAVLGAAALRGDRGHHGRRAGQPGGARSCRSGGRGAPRLTECNVRASDWQWTGCRVSGRCMLFTWRPLNGRRCP